MISIHASRGGSDRYRYEIYSFDYDFNPRFPWGKRRYPAYYDVKWDYISIHASRGGSDYFNIRLVAFIKHFNPRFPWGKRPLNGRKRCVIGKFQSTLPVGEATLRWYWSMESSVISIHASRGGSDFSFCQFIAPLLYFNPRFPWGKRPSLSLGSRAHQIISIHASRGGSDLVIFYSDYAIFNFNPRFPWGKRR